MLAYNYWYHALTIGIGCLLIACTNYCPYWKQLRPSLDRHLLPCLFGQPRSMSIFCVLYLSSRDGLNCALPLTPLKFLPLVSQDVTLFWIRIGAAVIKWKSYWSMLLLLLLLRHFSRVWLCATPWTAAYQAPPSMGFSRQESWSGVPLPSPHIGV